MSFKKLVMGSVAAAVLATSGVATAGEIEANVALSTDYIFRGISQTNNDPAISGGFDYSFDSGFYAGVWASNVEFDDVSTEIDLYGGYAFEAGEGVEIDFGYIYYTYPGDSGSLNYSEYTASISFDDLGFGIVYSPDYFGSDEDAVVFNIDYSVGIAKNLSLDLHSGYIVTSLDDNDDSILIPGTNLDNYSEYSIGLSTSTAGVDLSLTYHDTSISNSLADANGAENRIVFSVGKSF